MLFLWKRKDVLCVGVCPITVEHDCAACICEGVFKTVVNSNADFDMAEKTQRGRLFVQEKRIWTTKKHQKKQWSMFVGKCCKAQRNCYPKKYGNPNSTNNSLAHSEEMLDNETLQATTRSSHDVRGQVKARTILCCYARETGRIRVHEMSCYQ